MRRAAAAAVCALLLASAARGEDRFADRESAISLGGGLAYEFVGFNLALRRKNFEGYLGLGLLSVLPGVAIGGRYYLRPDGTGFFFALNLAGHADNIRIDQTDSTGGRLFWATITPGFRLAWDSFFLQAALGAGAVYDRTFWSSPPSPTGGWHALPDAMIAAGFRI